MTDSANEEDKRRRLARARPVSGLVVTLAVAGLAALGGLQLLHEKRLGDIYAGRVDAGTVLSGSRLLPVQADEMIALAEYISAQAEPDLDFVSATLERALEEDPDQPFAWALLADVRTRKAGHFSADAHEAMRQSLRTCPLCNPDLIRWRLSFVLAHWAEAPGDIRFGAFEGADLLRWWYLEYDYLNQIGDLALKEGIPFERYRRAVNSPVRPWEVGG